MMTQYCTFCHKNAQNVNRHQHGQIMNMTKKDFVQFEQEQFIKTMKQNNDYIDCTPDGYGSMQFYCPFCRSCHRHGFTREDRQHRIAHCSSPDSPFRRYGYYIKLQEDKNKLKKYCKKPTGLDAFIPKIKGLDEFLWNHNQPSKNKSTN